MLALSISPLGLNLAPRASVRMAAGGEQILLARFGVPAPDLSVDRRGALGLAAAAAAAGRAPARAFAADKGKEYNDCMSKCMYEVPV